MGNIDFRTGDLTGKLGGLVGARWKETNYARRFVVPANPNTASQQLIRNAWTKLVSLGRRINSTILKLYTIPKPKTMSAFNRFMQINKAQIAAGLLTFSTMVAAIGSLFIKPITAVTATAASNQVLVEYSDEKQGEALDTDLAIVFGYNEDLDLFAFSTTTTRVDTSCVLSLEGVAGNTVHVWMFFVQGAEISSESKYETDVFA